MLEYALKILQFWNIEFTNVAVVCLFRYKITKKNAIVFIFAMIFF